MPRNWLGPGSLRDSAAESGVAIIGLPFHCLASGSREKGTSWGKVEGSCAEEEWFCLDLS